METSLHHHLANLFSCAFSHACVNICKAVPLYFESLLKTLPCQEVSKLFGNSEALNVQDTRISVLCQYGNKYLL